MALHSNPHSELGRTEQIISQFFLKSLHIILESRIPSLCPHNNQTSISRARKNDKWFNLVLGDRPAALENLNFWQRNVMHPMIIDVILIHEGPSFNSSDLDDLYTPSRGMMETVIERWVVQYKSLRTPISQSAEGPASYKKMYKKLLIVLRSLYSTLRLLPAFRIYRQLTSSTQTYDFDLSYKVYSFNEPFSRAEEEEMKQYDFVPVETPFGQLCISTTYRPTLSNLNLERSNSLPPQIITDYVGSPATDRLKVFPDKDIFATSFPLRDFRSPSIPFHRPHSWTSGLHRASPSTHHLMSASPQPYTASSISDFHPSPPDPYGQKIRNYRPSAHRKIMSSDEYRLSPPFSPSPSPSPPAYLSGSPLQSRLRSESASAPVGIPLSMMGKSHRFLTPNSSDSNKHFLPPPSPRSTKPDISSLESPSESRSFRKLDALRAGEHAYSGHKVIKDSKDDSGRFSGEVSSSGSPRIGFSRSSSRLSFQDEVDDCDFSCPFALDDVDAPDSQARTLDGKEGPESTQMFPLARKSQDAAVGILVRMLRTAPPLRQDHSFLSQPSKSEFDGEVTASGFFMPRKTTDALEELRSYREMKDMLLSQSGTQLLGSVQQGTKEP
ncbi:autophagy-related protein 13 [Tasmannia lanceolata]|uniref:autophagy-related protein 13 n=1 Tax=Tasmannia lanceolata TaxID=3420 RepID=UPI004063F174